MVTPRMSHVPPEPEPWQPHPWMAEALCRQVGSNIFYAEPPDGLSGKFLAAWTRNANAEAKSVCARCPVRDDCLDHAIDTDERWGVWGGMTPPERRKEARRRPGRPEKAPPTARDACGTGWGWKQHYRAGEAACRACNDYNTARKRAQRERRAAA